ncbi:hypothetical protein F5146DRAFT_1123922 [Armillaria mellea]|nr:hypothetical protein F5146DRAFT_1123922 [Armillaria mellea]
MSETLSLPVGDQQAQLAVLQMRERIQSLLNSFPLTFMASFAAVNIHLSYRNAQVLTLSIPIVNIRYVAFTVFGAIGHLTLMADGSAVEDKNITWESQDRLCEDYYYIPDVSEAIHLLPKSKGDEYIQTVHQDHRHVYSGLPSSILEFESPPLEFINCVKNGILVRSNLHKMYVHGKIGFMKTPNVALNPEDIPRVKEGDIPTSCITLQHIQPPQGLDQVAQHDTRITGSSNPPISAIILDFVYGISMFKCWSRGPNVEKMMWEHFEDVYKSIPPLPRKHRRHHMDQTSDSMLHAMDTVLALLMYVKGNTWESLAAEHERCMEEAELRAQEAGSTKVKQWLQG